MTTSVSRTSWTPPTVECEFVSPMERSGTLTVFVFYFNRNYVDQCTAVGSNLTFASEDTFILRGDYQNVVTSSESGRKSVRLKSTQTFEHHVAMYV